MPKQLLPLVSERSLLQETLARLEGWPEIEPPIIVCGNDHRFLVAEQLREIGVEPESIILEPVGRNTAPAIAVAAQQLREAGSDSLMLVLAADHVILDIEAFHSAVSIAAAAARTGRLVTFGIQPSRPHTGYGYIERGALLPGQAGCCEVVRFVEKPNRQTAEGYLAEGSYYWNSGMFLFRPEAYLGELERLRPEIASCAAQALAGSYRDLDFCRLEEESFRACPSDSIDYAVMERTNLAAVAPADMGWSDVGSWTALWEVQSQDGSGNTLRGDVYVDAVKNSLIRAESRIVAAVGVSDLIVVETPDAVLVAHKDHAQDVKKVVEHLKLHARSEHEFHSRVYRPWGWYEGIDAEENFQVKRIMVKPGAKLSLQMHRKRAEHWVVVRGKALVTRDGESQLICENQSTYIPIGTKHRLENPGTEPLHLIEVQSGTYLGEDDIVRFDDVYGRS
jgi:mannose-1-phosphate guanylyltransferase/mannose-1-phosphate guanylyltransferase/mannose-6-phosphate isomerase